MDDINKAFIDIKYYLDKYDTPSDSLFYIFRCILILTLIIKYSKTTSRRKQNYKKLLASIKEDLDNRKKYTFELLKE